MYHVRSCVIPRFLNPFVHPSPLPHPPTHTHFSHIPPTSLPYCHRAAAERAEQRAAESTRLWEGEVQSRTKLGVKMMEMEKFVGACEARLNKERERTALAITKKREVETRSESLFEAHAALERRASAAEDRASRLERDLESYRSGVARAPAVAAEMDAVRAEAREEVERLAAELAATQAHAELAAEARANAAIAQATATGKLVPRSELEAYKRQVDLEAQTLIDRKIEEINEALSQTDFSSRNPAAVIGQGQWQAPPPSFDSGTMRSNATARHAGWHSQRGGGVLASTIDPAVLRARSRARALVTSARANDAQGARVPLPPH